MLLILFSIKGKDIKNKTIFYLEFFTRYDLNILMYKSYFTNKKLYNIFITHLGL